MYFRILLNIDFSAGRFDSFAIYDMAGEVIYKSKIENEQESFTVPSGSFNHGVYFVVFYNRDATETIKVIKR
jgi:hypothetical protein